MHRIARRGSVRAIGLLALSTVALGAQATPHAAHIREYKQTFPTYPFGDPSPIPVVGRIYPYFRFDGFSEKSEQIGRASCRERVCLAV